MIFRNQFYYYSFHSAFVALMVLSLGIVSAAEEKPPVSAANSSSTSSSWDIHHEIIVSVKDQKMLLLTDGKAGEVYPISTSKFGIGDRLGSYATPLGKLYVRAKIGMGQPLGEVFKSRTPTGEVLSPNAPGRDPIVTRILWLEGVEAGNANAFHRGIYIHGTPEEKLLGRPASFGCIRMRSVDVMALCDHVGTGATVRIISEHLPLPHHAPKILDYLNPNRLVTAESRFPEHAREEKAE